MKAAETEIDWTKASDDSGLIEACRAAASVAAQFESAQPRFRRSQAHFNELFRKLYAAARRVAKPDLSRKSRLGHAAAEA